MVDAARRYFAASDYSELTKEDTVALAERYCRSIARRGAMCAKSDDTRVAFSSGDTTFVLTTRGSDWLFVGLHGNDIVEGLELDRNEILCASYLADELEKGALEKPAVAKLLRPVVRLTQSSNTPSKESSLTGIQTTNGYMTFYRKNLKVECHLFGNTGGPPLVSANMTLKQSE